MSRTTAKTTAAKTANYLAVFEKFERTAAAKGPSWLHERRRAGIEAFAALGFPSPRDESWRFTNISPVTGVAFRPASGPKRNGVRPEIIAALPLSRVASYLMVCVDGHYSSELSTAGFIADGVKFGSLAEAVRSHPDLIQAHLGRLSPWTTHPFAALNTAFLADGAFLYLPDGAVIEKPIHILFVATGREKDLASHARSLVVVGRNARATVVETWLGTKEAAYLTNATTEITIGERAVVHHIKVQMESPRSFHFACLAAHQERSSSFRSSSLSLGGSLVRNDVSAVLDGEASDCVLDGLYMPRGAEIVDNHTRIEHAKPHSTSFELYKGVLDGDSRAVFNGRIIVRQDAQKTDAKQNNSNLLLSESATVNSNPELEIFADDVRCTHGATIGNLDEDALFYLRSRGISEGAARGILTYGFAGEIVERIADQNLREALRDLVADRLPEGSRLS
jgi:Fe-S cluster assembly protein SufD